MKIIKLTYNQSKDVVLRKKRIEVKRDAFVYHIRLDVDGVVRAYTWLGNAVEGVKIIVEEPFDGLLE